jgi:hypothetical protein
MSEDLDQLLRPRFLQIANTLDDSDWDEVLQRSGTQRQLGRTQLPLRRPVLVLAILAAALAAAVAGAATGVLPIGTEIPLSREPQGDGLTYTSDRTIVARGQTPHFGPWQMSVATSDLGSCYGIEVDHGLPGVRGPVLSEGCGSNATFDAAGLSGGDGPGRFETLVYGPAPERAAGVLLTADRGVRVTAPTHDGPAGRDGDFYVLAAPPKLRNARITWTDKQGRPSRPAIYVPGSIDYSRTRPPGQQRPH